MKESKQASIMGIYYFAIIVGSLGGILLWIILMTELLLPITISRNFSDLLPVTLLLVAMGLGVLTIKKALPVLSTATDAVVASGLAGAVAGFVMCAINAITGAVLGPHQIDLLVFSLLIETGIALVYMILMGVFAALFGIFYVKVCKIIKI